MDQGEDDMNEAPADISEMISEKVIASLTMPKSTPLSRLDIGSKYLSRDNRSFAECDSTPWMLADLLLNCPQPLD